MSGLSIETPEQHRHIEVLREVSLFAMLGSEELDDLSAQFEDVALPKGAVVCSEGEPGDAFYVIESGELEVWGAGDRERPVSRLGPGDFFGEMALLLGQPRTATVTVGRPASLLALDKESFQRLLGENPAILEGISKALCQRLASTTRGEPLTQQTTVVGVFAPPGVKGKSLVASSLAALLAEFTGHDALLVSAHAPSPGHARATEVPLGVVAREPADRIPSRIETSKSGLACLSVGLQDVDTEQALTEGLTSLVGKLGARFSVIVVDLCDRPFIHAQAVEQSCDVVIHVTDRPGMLPTMRSPERTRVFEVVNLYNAGSVPIPINHCEPFVLPADLTLPHLDPTLQARHILEHPWSQASPPLRRLARKILGMTVGIAVGGGGAFGIAHVGVLRVLEDHGVPIDLVAGTSMGSIVGVGYAAGIRPAEMYDIASRIGTKWMTLSALDFTVTKPGILAGDRIVRIFSPLLGSVEDFKDLQLPCRTVAADVESGERVWLGSGRLETAFRASCSVPLLWAPVRHRGRVLVDGAVAEPVPVGVLREMGADICIAINVVPRLQKGVDTVLSRAYRRLNAFNPLAYIGDSLGLPNTFDIVMNSMQTLQHELGNFNALSADVRINPDLAGFTWIEFYRPTELIERGAEAAERALPDIERALEGYACLR